MRPRDWFPRSHWNRGIRFRSLIETAETDSAVSLRPRDPNFATDYLDFLGENKAICKTAFSWHCPFKRYEIDESIIKKYNIFIY
jgi:hypothetical protein